VKKPVTVYTIETVRRDTLYATGFRSTTGFLFDLVGGRDRCAVRSMVRSKGFYVRGPRHCGHVKTLADAIRWVALGVLPDEVR
jgi:hypothetical protein